MPRPYTGKKSESKVYRKQANGSVYVYIRTYWYDPSIKNTRSTMKLQGIQDPNTGEIQPTRPKSHSSPLEPAKTPVKTTVKANAMIRIIRYYSNRSGVTEEVMSTLPEDPGRAEKILTLAWFAFATKGKAWTAANVWTAQHLEQLPYPYGSITKDIYQDLFHYIGMNSGIEDSIFQARAKQLGEGEIVAWDSTTYQCGVKDVHDGAIGVHKDGLIKRIIKVFYFYSVTSRQLIGYVKIHGNIPDNITVAYALSAVKAWGLNKPEILQDNGYTNDYTLGELFHQGTHFITRVTTGLSWVKSLIDKHRDALECGDAPSEPVYCDPEFNGIKESTTRTFYYVRKYASTAKGLEAGETDEVIGKLHVFIYYSSLKKGEDDKKLRENLYRVLESVKLGRVLDKDDIKIRDKYIDPIIKRGEIIDYEINKNTLIEETKYHGYLILISNHEKDINEALKKFRTRERIEESIKGHKSYTGGDESKTGSDTFLDGELLVEFLANSIRESMLSNLRRLCLELGIPNGERTHDLKENLDLEASLVKWLNRRSIQEILDAYDTIDIKEVCSESRSSKMTTSTIKRDTLFLNLHGFYDWGRVLMQQNSREAGESQPASFVSP